MDELEKIELSAVLDFFAAAPPDVADALDVAVFQLGDPAAFSIGAYPKMRLFNRVLGLDEDAQLPDLEAWFDSRRCAFAISVRPEAALETALLARGYRPGRAFVKLRRSVDEPPEAETSLRIERIDQARANEYGVTVATVFGIGSPLDRWFAALSTRAGWACFGAFDGDRLVGTGASHVAGSLGWLGAAGTLPEARGRGARRRSSRRGYVPSAAPAPGYLRLRSNAWTGKGNRRFATSAAPGSKRPTCSSGGFDPSGVAVIGGSPGGPATGPS